MSHQIKILLFAVLILAVAGGVSGFAVANNAAANAAGYKNNSVSKYAITGIMYDRNAIDPTMIENITFTVAPIDPTAPAAAFVKVQTATAGPWTICSLAAGTGNNMTATCAFPKLTHPLAGLDVTALNVVASSSLDLAS